MSTVCSDKGNPVRHARPSTALLRIDSGEHPGWTAKELDSAFAGMTVGTISSGRLQADMF
jgi:hypothetical protein